MKNSFVVNIIFLVFINLLIKPFYVFFIEVSVQNTVGNIDYGIYFSLFNLCYLFQIICDLGIQNYSTKQIAQGAEKPSQFISNILGFKLILSIVFICWIALMVLLLNYDTSLYQLLGLVAFNQILVSFILYLRTNISALGYYSLDSLVSVLDKILLIVMLAYLLWYSGDKAFSIYDFVYTQSVAFIITLVLVLIIIVRLTGLKRISWIPSFNRELLKKTMPYALVILLMGAYARIDAVMLERLLDQGKMETGIYAASYRLLDAVNIVPFLFASLLLPMFSKVITNKKDLSETFVLSGKLIFCISSSLAIYIYCYGDELMTYLYPQTASGVYATSILKNLMFGFVAISLTHIFSTIITASGRLKHMNIVFTIGLILNVILNLVYIPTHKALAASLTTLATESFVAICLFILVRKQFMISIQMKDIIQLTLFLLLIFLIYMGLDTYSSIKWTSALIIGVLSSIMVLFLLRILDIRELKSIRLGSNNLP